MFFLLFLPLFPHSLYYILNIFSFTYSSPSPSCKFFLLSSPFFTFLHRFLICTSSSLLLSSRLPLTLYSHSRPISSLPPATPSFFTLLYLLFFISSLFCSYSLLSLPLTPFYNSCSIPFSPPATPFFFIYFSIYSSLSILYLLLSSFSHSVYHFVLMHALYILPPSCNSFLLYLPIYLPIFINSLFAPLLRSPFPHSFYHTPYSPSCPIPTLSHPPPSLLLFLHLTPPPLSSPFSPSSCGIRQPGKRERENKTYTHANSPWFSVPCELEAI